MTENEAIEWQESFRKTYNNFPKESSEACDLAIKALKEIQPYRALGTLKDLNYKLSHYNMYEILVEKYRELGAIEELQEAIIKAKAYDQVAWERDIAISQLEEIGCSFGQKMDDIKEAIEKNNPKKYSYGNDNGNTRKCCSRCGCFFHPTSKYCSKCGQAIKHSEE